VKWVISLKLVVVVMGSAQVLVEFWTDSLESFLLDGLCLYERVLVMVGIERGMFSAWLYNGGIR